jgi:hypothetical protein
MSAESRFKQDQNSYEKYQVSIRKPLSLSNFYDKDIAPKDNEEDIDFSDIFEN